MFGFYSFLVTVGAGQNQPYQSHTGCEIVCFQQNFSISTFSGYSIIVFLRRAEFIPEQKPNQKMVRGSKKPRRKGF